jgi:predicted O-methyltransferase YrrM
MSADRRIDSQRNALHRALQHAPTVDLGPFEAEIDAGRWTLDHSMLRLLWALVQETRPRHVMEFGSGLSTRVLAGAAKAAGAETLISSIDHDPEYGAEAARRFAREDGAASVAFQTAPLVVRGFAGELLPAYCIDEERLACADPVELGLIDGPPEPLGGRAGTLYQMMQYAHPGTLVLLDDAGRPGEQAALDQWQNALGPAIEVLQPSGFPKGLATILIHQQIPNNQLWEHRQELAIADITALVPANESLILVDDWQWDRSRLGSYSLQTVVGDDGSQLGPPADDCESLSWFDAVKRQGVRFVVFGWPAFWWQRTYPALWQKLQRETSCILCNQRVIIFDTQLMHHKVK